MLSQTFWCKLSFDLVANLLAPDQSAGGHDATNCRLAQKARDFRMPPHFVKNYIDTRLLDDLTEQDDRVGAGKWDGHRSKPWPSSILGPSARL